MGKELEVTGNKNGKPFLLIFFLSVQVWRVFFVLFLIFSQDVPIGLQLLFYLVFFSDFEEMWGISKPECVTWADVL